MMVGIVPLFVLLMTQSCVSQEPPLDEICNCAPCKVLSNGTYTLKDTTGKVCGNRGCLYEDEVTLIPLNM